MRRHSAYPANRIRHLREERALTQEQLAEKTGTTNQQIGRLENRERRLTWDWMQRIAAALECHPMDLVEETVPASASDDERKLLESYRALPDEEKRTVSNMADYLAEKTAPAFKSPKNS